MKSQRTIGLIALTATLLLMGGAAHAIVYCNITKIEARELKNGVQITVSADGSLEFEGASGVWRQRVWLQFPGAKRTGVVGTV